MKRHTCKNKHVTDFAPVKVRAKHVWKNQHGTGKTANKIGRPSMAGVSTYTLPQLPEKFGKGYWMLTTYLLFAAFGLHTLQAQGSYVSPLPTGKQSSVKVYAAEVTPEPTYSDPLGIEVKNFLRRVHTLETSQGRNTNPNALHSLCKVRGGSNEYGYGGMAMQICFGSHEEATARVARWYREHRETLTEAESYCMYNIGVKTEDCEYYQKARSL